jgi:hypothetical protein
MRLCPIHLEVALHGLHNLVDQVSQELVVVDAFQVFGNRVVERELILIQPRAPGPPLTRNSPVVVSLCRASTTEIAPATRQANDVGVSKRTVRGFPTGTSGSLDIESEGC